MKAATWYLRAIDARSAALRLSRLLPWGAEGGLPDVVLSASHAPQIGQLDDLLTDTDAVCVFAAEDIAQPGFWISLTWTAPVELWGVRFAGPSRDHWPVRHSVQAMPAGPGASNMLPQWLGTDVLSPAPSKQPAFDKTEAVWHTMPALASTTLRKTAVSDDFSVMLFIGSSAQAMFSRDGGGSRESPSALASGGWWGGGVSGDGNTIVACSASPAKIAISKNRGATWANVAALSSIQWRDAYVSENGESILLIPFQAGVPYLSKDGGASFAALEVLGAAAAYTAGGISADGTALIVLRTTAPRLMKSNDGGLSWSALSHPSDFIPNGCALSRDGRGLMTFRSNAGSPALSKNGGITWEIVAGLWSNRTWSSASFSADNSCISVASNFFADGTVLGHTQNAGAGWQIEYAPANSNSPFIQLSKAGLDICLFGTGMVGYQYSRPDTIYTAPPIALSKSSMTDTAIRGPSATSPCARRAHSDLLAQDQEFGGCCTIYGTVELYAQAGNIPLSRRVRLHRSRDGLLVRETWSDAQGNYRFDGITDRYKYDVIAWDHEGLQQSVVANDQTPEVMP